MSPRAIEPINWCDPLLHLALSKLIRLFEVNTTVWLAWLSAITVPTRCTTPISSWYRFEVSVSSHGGRDILSRFGSFIQPGQSFMELTALLARAWGDVCGSNDLYFFAWLKMVVHSSATESSSPGGLDVWFKPATSSCNWITRLTFALLTVSSYLCKGSSETSGVWLMRRC